MIILRKKVAQKSLSVTIASSLDPINVSSQFMGEEHVMPVMIQRDAFLELCSMHAKQLRKKGLTTTKAMTQFWSRQWASKDVIDAKVIFRELKTAGEALEKITKQRAQVAVEIETLRTEAAWENKSIPTFENWFKDLFGRTHSIDDKFSTKQKRAGFESVKRYLLQKDDDGRDKYGYAIKGMSASDRRVCVSSLDKYLNQPDRTLTSVPRALKKEEKALLKNVYEAIVYAETHDNDALLTADVHRHQSEALGVLMRQTQPQLHHGRVPDPISVVSTLEIVVNNTSSYEDTTKEFESALTDVMLALSDPNNNTLLSRSLLTNVDALQRDISDKKWDSQDYFTLIHRASSVDSLCKIVDECARKSRELPEGVGESIKRLKGYADALLVMRLKDVCAHGPMRKTLDTIESMVSRVERRPSELVSRIVNQTSKGEEALSPMARLIIQNVKQRIEDERQSYHVQKEHREQSGFTGDVPRLVRVVKTQPSGEKVVVLASKKGCPFQLNEQGRLDREEVDTLVREEIASIKHTLMQYQQENEPSITSFAAALTLDDLMNETDDSKLTVMAWGFIHRDNVSGYAYDRLRVLEDVRSLVAQFDHHSHHYADSSPIQRPVFQAVTTTGVTSTRCGDSLLSTLAGPPAIHAV